MGNLGQYGSLGEEDSSMQECKELLPVRLFHRNAEAVGAFRAKNYFL